MINTFKKLRIILEETGFSRTFLSTFALACDELNASSVNWPEEKRNSGFTTYMVVNQEYLAGTQYDVLVLKYGIEVVNSAFNTVEAAGAANSIKGLDVVVELFEKQYNKLTELEKVIWRLK